MSIRERAHKFADEHMKPCGTHTVYCMVKFAESERELQRQECADAAEKWWDGDGTGRAAGEWWEELRKEILSAGTEPTNPFGCECGWEWVSRDPAIWDLASKRGRHISDECDFCPKCGKAKRREQ